VNLYFRYRDTVNEPEELSTPPIKKIERNIKLKIIPGKLNAEFLKRLEKRITGNIALNSLFLKY